MKKEEIKEAALLWFDCYCHSITSSNITSVKAISMALITVLVSC